MNRKHIAMNNRTIGGFALLAMILLVPLFGLGQTNITSLSDIGSSGDYVITEDIDASTFTSSIQSFSGTLQANIDPATKMPYRIKNLNVPLITTLTGTVKNLVIENVTISQSGMVGAIACTANGAARIYNVGILAGTVGSTGTSTSANSTDCCGGLVGLLDGTARVVNCYNYADIIGGNRVGGIVGYNNFATNSDSDKLKTMVYSCMFYGDITGGANKAPIYNGLNISNQDSKGVCNFNYFRSEAIYVQNKDIQTYNCALSAETRYLQRFEFFRHLLNGHRKVAAWWVNSNTPVPLEMMKWVMIPDSIGSNHPYPVLKDWDKYPSVVNYSPSTDENKPRNQGRKMGTLSVTIQMDNEDDATVPFHHPSNAVINTSSLDLIITDKDTTHFNFNYYKVQLPYYNEVGTKNYNGNRVVTGWKIVGITGGTPGTYSTGEDVSYDANGNLVTPYNFADRYCTDKDLYSVSGRVFNQGAYWDVPEGVTAITIEPYWAKAAYVADTHADRVCNSTMTSFSNVPRVGGGQIYTNGNSYSINGESQVVYTSISNAVNALAPVSTNTVNDYAVVIVGNYHQYNGIITDKEKLYTVTTIDEDGDNEPDYSFILRFNSRTQFHPVKYDFVNLVGLGMAQKATGGKSTFNFGIPQPINWFEVTNTALFRVTQFEFDRSNRTAAPIILQGGVMEQWVSGQTNGVSNTTIYYHVGGNVWFKEFHMGCHQDKSDLKTKHPPISVTGGDYDAFYLTGLYANTINYEDNAECYINGGRFGTVAGTGMEGIGKVSDHTKGNITWVIDNADIKEFFAGGTNAAKPAEGSINTTISHSHVDFFCGGPKFGDMNSNRTVKTTANDCTFGFFFGAGYGGNSYYTAAPGNFTNATSDPWNPGDDMGYNLDWDEWVKGHIKSHSVNSGNYSNGVTYNGYWQDYISQFGGVSTAIDYQFLPFSDNTYNVARLFLKFVKFSLATTRSVTSTLTGCTIDSSFYGGGSLGKVAGVVESVLDGCTVKGNVFGAGYSATLPKVQVMNTGGFAKQPYYDKDLGVYLPGEFLGSIEYIWKPVEPGQHVNSTENAIDKINHFLYTEEDITKTNLGSVSQNVFLTIKGNSIVFKNVYGGGEESVVSGSTEVKILDKTKVLGNIYGGGNMGVVNGSTKVIVNGSVIE